jgi:hypothetical protein
VTVDDKEMSCDGTEALQQSQAVWTIPTSSHHKTHTIHTSRRKNKEIIMSPSIASRSQSPEQAFLAFGEDFVKSPEHLAASTQSIDFDGLLDSPLLLHEDLAAGCGGMLWPAGMRMAKYLLKMKRDEIRNAESMCVP